MDACSGLSTPFSLAGSCVAFGRSNMFNQTPCMATPARKITAPRHAKMSTSCLVSSGVKAWLRLRPATAMPVARVRFLSKYVCKVAALMTVITPLPKPATKMCALALFGVVRHIDYNSSVVIYS